MTLDPHPPPPTTFQAASRPVTTFQRAVRESASESIELGPDAVSRFLPGPDTLEIDERWPLYERRSRESQRRRRRRFNVR